MDGWKYISTEPPFMRGILLADPGEVPLLKCQYEEVRAIVAIVLNPEGSG